MGTCCLADSSSTITMKYFILALAAIGAVSASGAVTCDECQTAASDLVDRLLSEESIAEQIAILKLVVCPQLPADIDCEGTLDMCTLTWPAASTTTSCWSRTSALCWVSAPRAREHACLPC